MLFYRRIILCFLLLALEPIGIFSAKEEGEDNNQSATAGGAGKDNLQDLLGGFLEGMKEAFGELQKQPGNAEKEDKEKTEESAAKQQSDKGGSGGAGDGMAGLKNLVDSLDMNKLNQFIQNIASPENLVDLIPNKFQGLLPQEWHTKIARVMVTELDKVGEVWAKLSSYKTMGKFWKALQKKTPTLAELLTDIWADLGERWAKFEGGLEKESADYVQNIKSSFGRWLSAEVMGKFQKISTDARQNLRDSLQGAFPAVAPLMTKALENEAFRKWAEELLVTKGEKGKEEGKEEKKEKEKKGEKKGKEEKKEAKEEL